MSYHLVHVLNHGSRLSIDRGCLVCHVPGQADRRVPKQDVLALVIAARGISFSADCISDLIEANCVILHCNHSYRPIGKTIGLSQVVHTEIFETQISRQSHFSDVLWNVLLRAKVENQAAVLDRAKTEHQLREMSKNNPIDEGNTARHYWHAFFPLFDKPPKNREHRNAKTPVNQMLNYGYAVLGAILHRSLIMHGLNTTIGLHHKYRFKSEPFLYDLIEPLRPVCDYLVLEFLSKNPTKKMDDWIRFVASGLINYRVKLSEGKTVKLLYAIDNYVCAVADCYMTGEVGQFFIPRLTDMCFENRSEK